MERKAKTKSFQTLWGKYKYVLLVVLAGVILLIWPSGSEKKSDTESGTQPTTADTATLADTEAEMEQILSRIEGVGELKLMLTLENSGGQQLAQDTELSYSGETKAPDNYARKSETVVVSGDDGDAPVVTGITGPVYRGALVVCQGAEDAEVKLAVTNAVAALTGLSSDRITVVRCQ